MGESSSGESDNEISTTFIVDMRTPAGAIPQIGDWWLDMARRLVGRDERDLATLGRDLAVHVDRKPPFDKGTLSRFVKGTGPVTYQLIQALCIEFPRLPPPIVFPASQEEAVKIDAIHQRYKRLVGANDNDEPDVIPLRPAEDGRRRGKRVAGRP